MEKIKINIEEIVDDMVVDDEMYNVIMLNDEVTPFEYVILVLMFIFGMNGDEAEEMALHIHNTGQGIVATLPLDKAYEKTEMVDRMNEESGMLLQTTVEKI